MNYKEAITTMLGGHEIEHDGMSPNDYMFWSEELHQVRVFTFALGKDVAVERYAELGDGYRIRKKKRKYWLWVDTEDGAITKYFYNEEGTTPDNKANIFPAIKDGGLKKLEWSEVEL